MQLKDELTTRLKNKFPKARISVEVQGSSAFLGVISDDFLGHSQVQRQQTVYGLISDLIQTGELHAVTIHAKTLAETTDSD
ncbi:MAG: BolA/IbaG family iron-sulfur metabolism protein [Gammaproteobacteria bacterium]|nr:BolA/IbaG family iron-sulfur metabolism protein [Gammaproteobacteria bacterium]MYF37380.1 BolA/IbaG family iron-sulfur metabolism protein [Gammaproteobacteria bacterium]